MSARNYLEPGEPGKISNPTKTKAGTWMVNASARRQDGSLARKRITRQSKTEARKAAQTWAAAEAAKWSAGTTGRSSLGLSNESTVQEFCDGYISANADGFKETTLDGYRSALRVHIGPGLGGLRVRQLSSARLQTWLETLTPGPWDMSRKVLSGAWRWGRQRGFITAPNPVEFTDPAPVAPRETDSATVAEIKALIARAEAYRDSKTVKGPQAARSPWLVNMLPVFVGSGMRLAELTYMQWEDLDGDLDGDGPITLTVWGVKKRKKKTTREVAPGERDLDNRAPRKVVLPEFAVVALRAQRDLLGEAAQAFAWVWPTATGKALSSSNVERAMRSVRNYGDRPLTGTHITPHTLRRTTATWVADAVGEDVAGLALGHQAVTFTGRYYVDRRGAVEIGPVLQDRWERGM